MWTLSPSATPTSSPVDRRLQVKLVDSVELATELPATKAALPAESPPVDVEKPQAEEEQTDSQIVITPPPAPPESRNQHDQVAEEESRQRREMAAQRERELAEERERQSAIAEQARKDAIRQRQEAERQRKQAEKAERERLARNATRSKKPRFDSTPRSKPEPKISKSPQKVIKTRNEGVNRDAAPISKPQPRYPRTLERRKIGGIVGVQIRVNPRGRVASTSVFKSSGHQELDSAALASANRWRFRPALKNGEKIASTTRVNIIFRPR